MSGKGFRSFSKRKGSPKSEDRITDNSVNYYLDRGYNQNQIAGILGVSRQAISYHVHKKLKRKGKDDKITKLVEKGLFLDQIADEMGYTYRGIQYVLRRLNLTCRYRTPGRRNGTITDTTNA